MKTHLLGNVGKGPGQFHQGHASLGFGGFLLAHRWMTTGTSALLFFLGWGPQGASFLGILFGSMVGIGVRPLLLGRTGQLVPPRLGLPLFGCFLLNEFQYVGVAGGRGGVTGSRSTGIRLHLIEKPYLLFFFFEVLF